MYINYSVRVIVIILWLNVGVQNCYIMVIFGYCSEQSFLYYNMQFLILQFCICSEVFLRSLIFDRFEFFVVIVINVQKEVQENSIVVFIVIEKIISGFGFFFNNCIV